MGYGLCWRGQYDDDIKMMEASEREWVVTAADAAKLTTGLAKYRPRRQPGDRQSIARDKPPNFILPSLFDDVASLVRSADFHFVLHYVIRINLRYRQTDGQTDGRTDGRTDRRMDELLVA